MFSKRYKNRTPPPGQRLTAISQPVRCLTPPPGLLEQSPRRLSSSRRPAGRRDEPGPVQIPEPALRHHPDLNREALAGAVHSWNRSSSRPLHYRVMRWWHGMTPSRQPNRVRRVRWWHKNILLRSVFKPSSSIFCSGNAFQPISTAAIKVAFCRALESHQTQYALELLFRLDKPIRALDFKHMHFIILVCENIDLCPSTFLRRKNDVPFDRIIIILDAVIEPLDVSVVLVQCETPSVIHCQQNREKNKTI